MSSIRILVVAGLVLGVVACAMEGDPVSGPDTSVPVEVAAADTALELPPVETLVDAATEMVDLAAEVDEPETVDVVMGKDLGMLPGDPGYPCQDGDDCTSGYCIQTPQGKQCTMNCIEECPFDWVCVQYEPSLPDEVYICVPLKMNLCKPCLKNSDCLTNGAQTGDACIPYGPAGDFCGASCMGTDDCPGGYDCQKVLDIWGYESNQCVLAAGECDCEPWFVDEGASTQCQKVNDAGACPGERVCTANGLTACDAPEPSKEMCNGQDDDCNGEVDEGAGGDTCLVENQWGACKGIYNCFGGQLDCDADEPAAELCDGKDNDCDGVADEGFPDSDNDGVADCLENDIDGDGVVDIEDNCPNVPNGNQKDSDLDTIGDACDPDDDNDQVADEEDCAPLDKDIYPEAAEVCNAKDDDCNGMVDEGFTDSDADGLKDCVDIDDDNDGTEDVGDCGPTDPVVFPGAEEVCDGIDNDCDFDIDESFPDLDEDKIADCVDADLDGDEVLNGDDNCPKVANPEQDDLDGDGQGDACDPDVDGDGIPDGVDNCQGLFNPGQKNLDGDAHGDDCDDDVDGDEIVDSEDNCPLVANSGQEDFDEDLTGDACDEDSDGDGDPDTSDCAPDNPYVSAGSEEECDGIDNNCNGVVDELFVDTDFDGGKDCVDPDDDNDGDSDVTDCEPLNGAVHAGAVESCNGVDDDCDEQIDEALGKLACGKGECFHTISKCVAGVIQQCDPTAGAELEVCDGKDNDCDGLEDEELGWASCGVGQCFHVQPNCVDGEVAVCDPEAGAKQEMCDGQDNDCDGDSDEEGAGDCNVYYLDADSDAHGVEDSKCLCGPWGLYTGTVNDDCDDLNPWNFPGATELCDGKDNNCDEEIDEVGATGCSWFFDDADGDGYGSGEPSCVCESPGQGWSVLAGDCDEEESEIHPGALELCDEADNDCDNEVDETFDLDSDAKNCGMCGFLCQPNNAFGKCVGGECKIEDCISGYADCNDIDSDGCEINTVQDVSNCGSCKNACDLPHGTAACASGLCAVGQCDEYYENDDGIPENGCEELTLGGSIDEPAESCKAIVDFDAEAEDGIYWVDIDGPGGGGPFEAFCEMTTDGGGWMFVAHVNGDYGSGNHMFTTPLGTYLTNRSDNGVTYSLGVLDDLADTEIMVTLDTPNPANADAANKIVFYKYDVNHAGFNSGPMPCSGLSAGFAYKTHVGGEYQVGGTTNSCSGAEWYTRTVNNQSYLILFHTGNYGNYWGSGMGGNDSWNHDGWWYAR